MEADIRCSALGGDLSAPKTLTTPTLANKHERPPEARLAPKNKQTRRSKSYKPSNTVSSPMPSCPAREKGGSYGWVHIIIFTPELFPERRLWFAPVFIPV